MVCCRICLLWWVVHLRFGAILLWYCFRLETVFGGRSVLIVKLSWVLCSFVHSSYSFIDSISINSFSSLLCTVSAMESYQWLNCLTNLILSHLSSITTKPTSDKDRHWFQSWQWRVFGVQTLNLVVIKCLFVEWSTLLIFPESNVHFWVCFPRFSAASSNHTFHERWTQSHLLKPFILKSLLLKPSSGAQFVIRLRILAFHSLATSNTKFWTLKATHKKQSEEEF